MGTETQGAAQPQTQEQFQAAVAAIDNRPFRVGESGLDKATEKDALYKARYGTGEHQPGVREPQQPATGTKQDGEKPAGQEPAAATQQPIAWGDAKDEEVSPATGEYRKAVEAHFSQAGMTSEQSTTLVAGFRHYFASGGLTDEQWQAMEIATDNELRKEWGKDYDAKLTKAYAIFDAFKNRFPHADIEKAVDNGALIDPNVLRTLASVEGKQGGAVRQDIGTLRDELLKTNQGSPRYKQLLTQIENHYKAVHGNG